MYGSSHNDLGAKLQAMEEENLRLRQKVLASNEQIFDLQASIMTCDAEAKFYVETEMKKIQSETNFRNKEFAALNRDHQSVLKELNALKQSIKSSNVSNAPKPNVITPSQLATMAVSTPNNSTSSSMSNNVAENSIKIETATSQSPIMSANANNNTSVSDNSLNLNMYSMLVTQFHSLLQSLSFLPSEVSESPSLTNVNMNDKNHYPTTPQPIESHSKSVHSNQFLSTGQTRSSRLSPASLSRMKLTAQIVEKNALLEEQTKLINEQITKVSECFYALHSTITDSDSMDLSHILMHELALAQKLLSWLELQQQNIEREQFTVERNEPLRLCLSLIFSTLSFADQSIILSNIDQEEHVEIGQIVGNLSKKFEQVASGVSHASETKSNKRKRDNTDNSTIVSMDSKNDAKKLCITGIKLPSLTQTQLQQLNKFQSKKISTDVANQWAEKFCSLCDGVFKYVMKTDFDESLVSAVVSTLNLLFQQFNVNAADILSCLTAPSSSEVFVPSIVSILLCEKVDKSTKNQLVSVMGSVLVNKRVFHAFVVDQQLHAINITASDSKSANKEDEEERPTTTSTDGVDHTVDGKDVIHSSKSFLHVLADLLIHDDNSTIDNFMLQIKIVGLFQDLLSRHGCQFICWLVGRDSDEILNAVGEVDNRLYQQESTAGISRETHKNAGSVAVVSTKTPTLKRSSNVDSHLSPVATIPHTPASTNVKLPIDFESFEEGNSVIDRFTINCLVDVLKNVTRHMDVMKFNNKCAMSPLSSEDASLHNLYCVLTYRLINLFNGIAGRMTPKDWLTLIADRNDFMNAFICRTYVNNLHSDIYLRGQHIEYLERDAE